MLLLQEIVPKLKHTQVGVTAQSLLQLPMGNLHMQKIHLNEKAQSFCMLSNSGMGLEKYCRKIQS